MLSGALRLTWVSDQLAHVLEHSRTDETPGTWMGLACPDHGLQIGADVDNTALRRLAVGDLADLVWEALDDFTAEHTRVGLGPDPVLYGQATALGHRLLRAPLRPSRPTAPAYTQHHHHTTDC
jgi:hypothetical protein